MVALRFRHPSPVVCSVLLTFLMLAIGLGRARSQAPAKPAPAQASSQAEKKDDKPAPAGPFRLHGALHAPDWLLFGGSQRTRYEGLANQFRPGLDAHDQAVLLRTLLTLGARFRSLSVVGELQDARAYLTDEQSGISTIVVNALEPLQAYANLHLDEVLGREAVLDLRVGRQSIDLGSRRLIARNRFRNTIQSYDGITSRFRSPGGTELFAFVVLPVLIEPESGDRAALLKNRIELDRERLGFSLWGVHFKRPLWQDVALETYLFGLHERDGAGYPTRNRRLYTEGLRLVRAAGEGVWDVDVESVLQLGSRRSSADPADVQDRRVLAHFHHASLGYTFEVPWLPRLSAELDYASGDAASTPGRNERFDSLFGPRRADFGPTNLYGPLGRENIISAGLRAGAEPAPRLDGYVSFRANWLASTTDTFARTGVRDPDGQSGRFAGHQIELRTRVWLLMDTLRWELGGAALIVGPFLRDAPNATRNGHPLFAYTDLEWLF